MRGTQQGLSRVFRRLNNNQEISHEVAYRRDGGERVERCVWLMPVDSALKYLHGRHIGRIADRLGLPQERGLVTRQNGELTEVWSWRASRDLYQEKATYLTGEVKTDKGKMPFSGKSYTYEPAGMASHDQLFL